MLYSHLFPRRSAVLAILFSISAPFTYASPAPQAAAVAAAAAAPAATQANCLGVGISVIPDAGPGPDAGAASDASFSAGSSDGSSGGSSYGSSSGSSYGSSGGLSAPQRRDLFPGNMDQLIYERQSTDGMNGGPISIPANTIYCGWLGGAATQTDMLNLNPGTYQLTWQNVTGDGQISINYSQAGADSSWAPQDAETPDQWPTIQAFANDGVQYQAVYYGEYPQNGLSWFISQTS
ncbi:hypothetical protein MMC13_005839 [Lambiella insularis]|nr:hypothetical protein [Lambiella insularis]